MQLLSTAMTDGLPGPNDLAFFALTSKIEGVVRDSVALHIHRKYPALVATREFRRCDLAVFDPQDNEGSNASTATALFSIEFKADGSGKFRTPEGSKDAAKLVTDDLAASPAKCPRSGAHFAILTVVAIHGNPDRGVSFPWAIKYYTGVERYCDRTLTEQLRPLFRGSRRSPKV